MPIGIPRIAAASFSGRSSSTQRLRMRWSAADRRRRASCASVPSESKYRSSVCESTGSLLSIARYRRELRVRFLAELVAVRSSHGSIDPSMKRTASARRQASRNAIETISSASAVVGTSRELCRKSRCLCRSKIRPNASPSPRRASAQSCSSSVEVVTLESVRCGTKGSLVSRELAHPCRGRFARGERIGL